MAYEIKIRRIKANKNVESIMQFGSSVEKKQFRDIDLCIFPKKKFTLKEKLKLLRNLPEKYDFCFYDDLPLNLKKEVLSKGKVLFTKNYLKLLQRIQFIDLEYPRYASFLKGYHKDRMRKVSFYLQRKLRNF